MKQFVGGLILGVGIGILICGLLASSMVTDFESTLKRYETHIDSFYNFTHSYSFEAMGDVIEETTNFYKNNILLREALQTFGLGQLGQLLQDVNENLDDIYDISEDLYSVRSSVQKVSSQVRYLQGGGAVLAIVGIIISAWVFYRE